MNCDHVGAVLLDCLLSPLAWGIDYVLIVHLDGLGHADGHVEDVHGDLGGMGHGCIREERHSLLAAQLDYMTAASAVRLCGTQSDLLDGVPPGLVYADAEFGAGQSACYLEGWHGCGSCCQILGSWRHGLRYCYGLEQVLHGIADRLGEVHELHGDLGCFLSEIVSKERADAAGTCIYFNLYITLDS